MSSLFSLLFSLAFYFLLIQQVHCQVEKKKIKCKIPNEGKTSAYIGDINKTNKNTTCLQWYEVINNNNVNLTANDFPYQNINHNHCRNPEMNASDAFCFVKDNNNEIIKEYCNIPECDKQLENATNNDFCTLLNIGKLKWVEENDIVCSQNERLELLSNQTFDECSINCQFDRNCMFFQLIPNKLNSTDCYLMTNLINCNQINTISQFTTWSKRYCTIKLYPFIKHDEICLDVEKNRKDKSRICEHMQEYATYDLKWIKDENVSCTSTTQTSKETIFDIQSVEECLVSCQQNNDCASVEIVKTNTMTCKLKMTVEICTKDKNSDKYRYWIGCCRRLGKLLPSKKPRAHCIFSNDPLYTNYNGEQSSTISGKSCLPWNERLGGINKNQFADNSNDHAFCRNINEDPKGPWCFVSGSFMYEYCNVTKCKTEIPIVDDRDVICYEKTNKEMEKCLVDNHIIQWVQDESVICEGNVTNKLSSMKNASVLECQLKCLNTPTCVSFEMEDKTKNRTADCNLMSKIRTCHIDFKKGKPRWSIGCCQKLKIMNYQRINGPKMDTCRQKHEPLPPVYIGTINITKTNRNCLLWTVIKDTLSSAPYPYEEMKHNYCRNMNEDVRGPWCIVSGSTFYELCAIPQCNSQQIYVDDDDICLAEYTENCDDDYKMKWVMEKATEYCIDENPADKLVIVDYIPQCRDACIQYKCKSVKITEDESDPNKGIQFNCFLRMPQTPCKVVSDIPKKLIVRLWRGCCKHLHFNKPKLKHELIDCVTTKSLNNYYGKIATTRNNSPCLNWLSVRPSISKKYFPQNENDINSCRNLNSDENGPWCFTTGSFGIDYCDVPKCRVLTETATKDMICFQNAPSGLQKKCNKETELKWIVDQNMYCEKKTTAIVGTPNQINEIQCKLKCEDHDQCASLIMENQFCTLFAIVITCQTKPRADFVSAHRWYKGCCKILVVHPINENHAAPNRSEHCRVLCKATNKRPNNKEYIYVGFSTNKGTCLNWNEVRPEISGNYFPDKHNQHNYCRNPNSDNNGPWCVTSGRSKIEYCSDIKECLSFEIPTAQSDEICYEDSSLQQSECTGKKFNLKWIQEDKMSCDIKTHFQTALFLVYGLVDCKERCFERNDCKAIIFENNNETNDGRAHHSCKLLFHFPICKIDKESKETFIWVGCCQKLVLRVKNSKIKKKTRKCLHSDPKVRKNFTYNGNINKTITGKNCLNWNELKPAQLKFADFPEKHISHNYCRNPNDDEQGPWCFTSGSFAYELCQIPPCSFTKTVPQCQLPSWFIYLLTLSWTLTCMVVSIMIFSFYRKNAENLRLYPSLSEPFAFMWDNSDDESESEE